MGRDGLPCTQSRASLSLAAAVSLHLSGFHCKYSLIFQAKGTGEQVGAALWGGGILFPGLVERSVELPRVAPSLPSHAWEVQNLFPNLSFANRLPAPKTSCPFLPSPPFSPPTAYWYLLCLLPKPALPLLNCILSPHKQEQNQLLYLDHLGSKMQFACVAADLGANPGPCTFITLQSNLLKISDLLALEKITFKEKIL